MQLNTFNVQFILKTDKTNKKGLSPIFARIRINGKKMEITTNRSISSENWLSENESALLNPLTMLQVNDISNWLKYHHLFAEDTNLKRKIKLGYRVLF